MMDAFDRAVEREAEARRARLTRPIWCRFTTHLRIYVVVNVALAAVWGVGTLVGNANELWFLNVLWGWGIGLLVHYLIVSQVTRQWRPPSQPSAERAHLREDSR